MGWGRPARPATGLYPRRQPRPSGSLTRSLPLGVEAQGGLRAADPPGLAPAALPAQHQGGRLPGRPGGTDLLHPREGRPPVPPRRAGLPASQDCLGDAHQRFVACRTGLRETQQGTRSARHPRGGPRAPSCPTPTTGPPPTDRHARAEVTRSRWIAARRAGAVLSPRSGGRQADPKG